MVLIQFINISSNFLYDQEKAKNDLLSIINASVSHDLRNPLNSISLQNEIKESLIQILKELSERPEPKTEKEALQLFKKFQTDMKDISEKLK